MSEPQTPNSDEQENRSRESRDDDNRRADISLRLSVTAMVLAGIAVIIVLVVSYTVLANRQDSQELTDRVQKAVCVVVDYGESQVDSATKNFPQVPEAQRQRTLDAINGLRDLTQGMRETDIECPPNRFKP